MTGEVEKGVEEALERFERALREVERTFAAEREAAHGLRGENERLQEELARLRSRAEELAAANRRALERLNDAMKTIRRLLGDDQRAA